jgi:uncharacterized protein (TIGR02117 family)
VSLVVPLRGSTARLVIVLLLLTSGCDDRSAGLFPPTAGDPTHDVFVVGHGWHAGIVLPRAELPAGSWPILPEIPAGDWLEVGWGDRAFYVHPDPGLGIALRAVLWPTPSVLHLAGFSGPVAEYFPASRITRLSLSPAGFEALLQYLSASFARDPDGAPRALGPGLYGQSQFYASTEPYHLFRTCNVWTARALRTAGIPITPLLTITTDALFNSLAEHGQVLRGAAAELP